MISAIIDTPTLPETMERILETVIITDNIRAAVASGELTPAEGEEVMTAILESE